MCTRPEAGVSQLAGDGNDAGGWSLSEQGELAEGITRSARVSLAGEPRGRAVSAVLSCPAGQAYGERTGRRGD